MASPQSQLFHFHHKCVHCENTHTILCFHSTAWRSLRFWFTDMILILKTHFAIAFSESLDELCYLATNGLSPLESRFYQDNWWSKTRASIACHPILTHSSLYQFPKEHKWWQKKQMWNVLYPPNPEHIDFNTSRRKAINLLGILFAVTFWELLMNLLWIGPNWKYLYQTH